MEPGSGGVSQQLGLEESRKYLHLWDSDCGWCCGGDYLENQPQDAFSVMMSRRMMAVFSVAERIGYGPSDLRIIFLLILSFRYNTGMVIVVTGILGRRRLRDQEFVPMFRSSVSSALASF